MILDAVYEWMKNLAFYLVIMTAVMEVVPGSTYKKYIQFFTGLVLILLVVTPILNFTGAFEDYQTEYHILEERLQEETERQKEKLESADVSELFSKGNEVRTDRIEVEDIKIGENQESDTEVDSVRE